MTAAENTPATAPETPGAPPNPPPAPAAPETPPKVVKKSLEDNLTGLDDDAKAFVLEEVRKARNEARGLRDRVRDSDPEKVKADLAKEIGKALGLVEDAPADPAALAAQIESTTTDLRESRTELAVYRLAGAAEADPAALLDSRTFMASVKGVDPTDHAAVTAAIQAAVTANPALGVAPTHRLPAPNPAFGANGGTPPTQAQILAAAERDGDRKTAQRMKADQLISLSQQQNTN